MESEFGTISVVMAAWNSENTISQAIKSVLAQTYKQLEIIVVDDCSSDRTVSIVKILVREDSRVKLVQSPKNRGVAYARRVGLDASTGNWIAILDSDDVWLPNKLEKQICLQASTNASLLFTGSGFMTSDGIAFSWKMSIPCEVNYRQLLKQNILSNSSALVRKELYIKHYVLKGEIHEDYAIWLKILRTGQVAYGVNEPLLMYRLSKSSKSGNKVAAAKMNWKTYRYVGLNILSSAYYMCWYAMNGLLKYRNLK